MGSIRELLGTARVIAVVGLSSKKSRPSYGVSEYMQRAGYRIIPVNPGETEVLGEKAYPSLDAVPEKIDIVDIFRRSEFVPEIVDQAIQVGAPAVWMQEGVIHEDGSRQSPRRRPHRGHGPLHPERAPETLALARCSSNSNSSPGWVRAAAIVPAGNSSTE